jgi:hypothetical protein
LTNGRFEQKTTTARRQEQVRHLVRSVGVEMGNGVRVPFFVEPVPGRFRQNPVLKSMEIGDDQLCTLNVAAETRAKIPEGGLPIEALRYLIAMAMKGGDDL